MFSLKLGACVFHALTQTAGSGKEPVSDLFAKWSQEQAQDPMMYRVILALAIVIFLIFAVAWLLRRYMKISPSGKTSGRLQVIESLPLGTKKMVQVVKVCGRTLVIGVTPERIELLTELPEEEYGDEECAPPQHEKKAKCAFGDILHLGRRKKKA